MKKIISVFLIVVLCFSLCACGDNSTQDIYSVEDAVEDAIDTEIKARIAFQYETTGIPTITHYVKETSENMFEVTGKVTVKDNYGDSYTGKYDAVVEYRPASGVCYVNSCDIGDLYKD